LDTLKATSQLNDLSCVRRSSLLFAGFESSADFDGYGEFETKRRSIV